MQLSEEYDNLNAKELIDELKVSNQSQGQELLRHLRATNDERALEATNLIANLPQ
jgi:hypothetical protein